MRIASLEAYNEHTSNFLSENIINIKNTIEREIDDWLQINGMICNKLEYFNRVLGTPIYA